MDIIYPVLVEQAAAHAIQDGHPTVADKAAMFKIMVEDGIIDANGQPTPMAIDKGYVTSTYEHENLSWEEFIDYYPVFKNYDPTYFEQINGFWEIPLTFRQQLISDLNHDRFTGIEKLQLQEYLSERSTYEN